MDGVLIDSENLYQHYWRRACLETGHSINNDDLMKLVGVSKQNTSSLIPEIFGNVDVYKEISNYRNKIIESDYLNDIKLKTGVIELLSYLKTKKISIALASSTEKARGKRTLEKLGILHKFDYLVFGDMVAYTKPSPESYCQVLDSLNIKSIDALVIEDSSLGIKAANEANIEVFWVEDLEDVTLIEEVFYTKRFNDLLEVKEYFKRGGNR